MTLTLVQAQQVVFDHLDDDGVAATPTDGSRWSVAQVNTGLGYALSSCLNEYLSSGGDRFDLELATTSSSAGLVDLSATPPLTVRGVSLIQGNRYWPLAELKPEQRGRHDDTARSIQIRYIRELALPSTTSHPLVGVGATAGRSWDAFDHWVCVRAAQFCSAKDDEARRSLDDLERKLRDSVFLKVRTPSATAFPRPASYFSAWYGYFYDPSAQAVQVCRRFS